MSNPSVPPRFVPTLTDVVQPSEINVLALEMPKPAVLLQFEDQMVHRVMQRVDSGPEPALARRNRTGGARVGESGCSAGTSPATAARIMSAAAHNLGRLLWCGRENCDIFAVAGQKTALHPL